ncbi:hypothetical protein [Streptomyces sp. NBC_01727]|uniref:hypothetical protein n=1 Tax=Streptomyces sp. NBC_01727 TaxID=2975924 RepID=UPI002E112148|nr:hypothetical protein OIE76_43550 [Streptomyces sp. NBC_01727]
MGESGAWGEVASGLRVSRPVLVARLLELDAAGALTSAHVRAGAQAGGVNVRTVWRWLEAARTQGRMERKPRARLELSEQAWEVLGQAGGNVAVLHRHLKDAGGEVPSLASLYQVVRRDLEAGRVLPDRAVVRRPPVMDDSPLGRAPEPSPMNTYLFHATSDREPPQLLLRREHVAFHL